MENKNKSVANEKRKKNSFLLIFVCVFLGISLILGATLGIIVGVSEAKAVASYNGIRVDRQTASYLASY